LSAPHAGQRIISMSLMSVPPSPCIGSRLPRSWRRKARALSTRMIIPPLISQRQTQGASTRS
jgi:hypothetical protein